MTTLFSSSNIIIIQTVLQELHTLPEHLNSPPVFSGVRVTRSLVLYLCFVDRCLSFCTFSFGHCVVCSAIYGFWLPLWYLQTLLDCIYKHEYRHQINSIIATILWITGDLLISVYNCNKTWLSNSVYMARFYGNLHQLSSDKVEQSKNLSRITKERIWM